MSSPLKPLEQFHQISLMAYCRKGIDSLFELFHAIEPDGRDTHILDKRL